MSLSLGAGVVAAVGLYLALLVGIGYATRRAGSPAGLSDFYLAGRSLGGFVLLLTLYATQYSGMPTSEGVELQRRFNERAYRSIYPNPFGVSDLLRASLEIEGLTEDQRDLLHATLDTYTQRNDQASGRMERRYLIWREFVAETLGKPRDKVDAYETDMLRLDTARQEAGVNAIALLKATLSPEQFEGIASIILEMEQRFLIAEERREYRLFRS